MYSIFTFIFIFENVFDVVEYEYTYVYARWKEKMQCFFNWLHHLTVSFIK